MGVCLQYLWSFIALQPCICQILDATATQMIQRICNFFNVKCRWTNDLIIGSRCQKRLRRCGCRVA